MSQAKHLPSIKKIELSVRQMRPPLNQDGTPPQLVGALDDGSPVYFGDIFLGNSAFQDGAKSDSGHERVPVMGPDGLVWRLNKSTGQKIMQVFRAKRRYVKRRYIIKDFGNGNAGPIPVPSVTPASDIDKEFDTLKDVLKAEGLSLTDFIKVLKKNAAASVDAPPEAEPESEGPAHPIKDEKGPWYTLSNGERVKGEEAAQAAELALKAPG